VFTYKERDHPPVMWYSFGWLQPLRIMHALVMT